MPSKLILSKDSGFTILEVLVVLSIVSLFTGMTIFSVVSERQSSSLFRSAQNLSLNLRRAQNYALSSKNFKNSGVPCGWGVHFNGVNLSSYVIFADSVPAGSDCQNQDNKRNSDGSEDFETVKFESGIKISSLTDNFSDVVFSPPAPTVVFSSSGRSQVSIVLTNRDAATRTVTVNTTGFISSP